MYQKDTKRIDPKSYHHKRKKEEEETMWGDGYVN